LKPPARPGTIDSSKRFAFPCTAQSSRGFAVSGLTLDEVAFFIDGERNATGETS
jgi:hypothetical protein